MSRETIRIRAPKRIMEDLRIRYPGIRDADLIRVVYHNSLVRAEVKITKFDKKLGKILNVKK